MSKKNYEFKGLDLVSDILSQFEDVTAIIMKEGEDKKIKLRFKIGALDYVTPISSLFDEDVSELVKKVEFFLAKHNLQSKASLSVGGYDELFINVIIPFGGGKK